MSNNNETGRKRTRDETSEEEEEKQDRRRRQEPPARLAENLASSGEVLVVDSGGLGNPNGPANHYVNHLLQQIGQRGAYVLWDVFKDFVAICLYN